MSPTVPGRVGGCYTPPGTQESRTVVLRVLPSLFVGVPPSLLVPPPRPPTSTLLLEVCHFRTFGGPPDGRSVFIPGFELSHLGGKRAISAQNLPNDQLIGQQESFILSDLEC